MGCTQAGVWCRRTLSTRVVHTRVHYNDILMYGSLCGECSSFVANIILQRNYMIVKGHGEDWRGVGAVRAVMVDILGQSAAYQVTN